MSNRKTVTFIALGLAIAICAPAAGSTLPAGADGHAPGDPALATPTAKLAAALRCSGPLAGAAKDPVLLVHGTGSAFAEDYEWNYGRFLPLAGWSVCGVQLPGRAVGDIQVSTEYVVYAIRRMAAESGRQVAVIGHSQGGLEPRWALKWWPGLTGLVSDVISMGTPQTGADGSSQGSATCSAGCAAALMQQGTGSKFLAALNAGNQISGGADYTSIATLQDELAFPQPRSSHVEGASNIVIQSICPNDRVEHFGLSADGPTYGIALDALEHAGPAVETRVSRSVCDTQYVPGLSSVDVLSHAPQGITFAVLYSALGPPVTVEPALKCYATKSCPGTAAARAHFAQLVALPSARRCVRRGVRIRSRAPGSTVRLVVRVGSGRARTYRGRSLRSPIVVAAPRRPRFTLRLTVTTRDGVTLRAARVYRTCGR